MKLRDLYFLLLLWSAVCNTFKQDMSHNNGECWSALKKCRAKLENAKSSQTDLVTLSVQKGRLKVRARDVRCQVEASKSRQRALTEQIVGLVNRKNEAQGSNHRLAYVREQNSCTLKRFDETAGKCIKQASLTNLTRLGDGIYYFYNDFNNGKNSPDAFLFCTDYGMKLVTIETEAENNLIKAKAQELFAQDPVPLANVDPTDIMKGKWFWLSLNDFAEEGRFVWPLLAPEEVNYTDWLKDEVNAPDGGRVENGVVLGEYRTPGNIHWDDALITTKGRFICEMPSECATFYKNVI